MALVDVRCRDCGGSGHVQGQDTLDAAECVECDGSGWAVEDDGIEDEESDDEDDDQADDCPVCGGSGGGADEWKCSTCHGTGRNLEAMRQARREWEENDCRDDIFDSWFIAEREWCGT